VPRTVIRRGTWTAGSAFVLAAAAVGAILLTPQECAACPPIVHITETLTLTPKAIYVNGVESPAPSLYASVRLTLEAQASEPSEVWLRAGTDSEPALYFARFR